MIFICQGLADDRQGSSHKGCGYEQNNCGWKQLEQNVGRSRGAENQMQFSHKTDRDREK